MYSFVNIVFFFVSNVLGWRKSCLALMGWRPVKGVLAWWVVGKLVFKLSTQFNIRNHTIYGLTYVYIYIYIYNNG